MTLATYITLFRLLMVPVFVILAIYYSRSVTAGSPVELIRYIAVTLYIITASTDALDGYLARSLDQKSRLGAFLDPIADKSLLLSGIITLAIFPWGDHDWRVPIWFAVIVFLRDNVILWGVFILYHLRKKHLPESSMSSGKIVPMRPLWTGKICTITQMIALGWVMLKPLPFSPVYPAILSAVFCIWSCIDYIRMGISLLPRNSGMKKQ